MTPTRPSFALLAVLLVFTACSERRAAKKGRETPGPASDVLVTVNDKAITEADLALKMRRPPHRGEEGTPEEAPDLATAQKKALLENIIRQELIAQRAQSLGLDDDASFRQELATMKASLEAFRRQKLVDLYERHQREETEVTDEEARRYFQEHAEQFQTELHVFQILTRDETRIDEAHRAIQGGTAFEEVAARAFPRLPEGARPPWDLGFLKYNQLPEPWRGVVDRLEKGQTSGIIPGPRNRFWIVKLVDRRRDPNVQFETFRANIIEMLRAERLEARRAQNERELRSKAKIRYVRDPRS